LYLSLSGSVFLPGDVNLDGDVNGLDVDPLVGRVTTGTYQVEADTNDDGDVNGLDVAPFVDTVIAGATQPVPEPSTLPLLAILGLLYWRRKER
jgi:hypothetical protein